MSRKSEKATQASYKMKEYRDSFAELMAEFVGELRNVFVGERGIELAEIYIDLFGGTLTGKTKLLRDFEDTVYKYKEQIYEKDVSSLMGNDYSELGGDDTVIDTETVGLAQIQFKSLIEDVDDETRSTILEYLIGLCKICKKYRQYRKQAGLKPENLEELLPESANEIQKKFKKFITSK